MKPSVLHSVQFTGAARVSARQEWFPIPQLFLKEWRLYKGFTQAQLGERVKRSEAAISRWESGRPVTSADLISLANCFHCEVPELFALPHAPTSFERLQRILPANDPETVDMIERIARIIVEARR